MCKVALKAELPATPQNPHDAEAKAGEGFRLGRKLPVAIQRRIIIG